MYCSLLQNLGPHECLPLTQLCSALSPHVPVSWLCSSLSASAHVYLHLCIFTHLSREVWLFYDTFKSYSPVITEWGGKNLHISPQLEIPSHMNAALHKWSSTEQYCTFVFTCSGLLFHEGCWSDLKCTSLHCFIIYLLYFIAGLSWLITREIYWL